MGFTYVIFCQSCWESEWTCFSLCCRVSRSFFVMIHMLNSGAGDEIALVRGALFL